MESSILSEVDNTSDSQDGLSTRLLLSSQLATNLSALAPAKRAGAQRLCALAQPGPPGMSALCRLLFSNRPFWVKHFQAIHHWGVDVARGLALLFGIGTAALPSWGSKARWNNLLGGLAVRRTAGPSGHTNSPHPSSREGHRSTTGWSSSFLLSHLIL